MNATLLRDKLEGEALLRILVQRHASWGVYKTRDFKRLAEAWFAATSKASPDPAKLRVLLLNLRAFDPASTESITQPAGARAPG